MNFDLYNHTQVASGRTASGELFAAIAEWCACLAGQKPLRQGLRGIGAGLGAAAVSVSRLRHGTQDSRRIVVCDLDPTHAATAPLTSAFAHSVLKEYAEKSKPGSLWFASMFDSTLDPRLLELQRRRCWRELVIIPIGTTDKHTDFLELHYSDKLDMVQLGLLDQVAQTLVSTWEQRASGLFMDAVLSRKADADLAHAGVPLLHIQNPANLSRCEYRVCLLISHGLNNPAIERELGISKSTLRSHLRSIYAKTETTSLAELTYALLSHAPVSRGGEHSGQRIA